jgi:ABC-type glycerol-3-phosphate transport system substrate-binding protein
MELTNINHKDKKALANIVALSIRNGRVPDVVHLNDRIVVTPIPTQDGGEITLTLYTESEGYCEGEHLDKKSKFQLYANTQAQIKPWL